VKKPRSKHVAKFYDATFFERLWKTLTDMTKGERIFVELPDGGNVHVTKADEEAFAVKLNKDVWSLVGRQDVIHLCKEIINDFLE
jgi:hypothetical protein